MPQEEVAAPYVRLLALLVRRNQATIGGERTCACLPACPSPRLPCQPDSWTCMPAQPQFGSPALPPPSSTHRPLATLAADYMQEMRLSLEHLALLPPNAALSLLLAVWPMCRCVRAWPADCARPACKLRLPTLPVATKSIHILSVLCVAPAQRLMRLPPLAAGPNCLLLPGCLPACRSRRDAQDYVVMLLRKAMFRCGQGAGGWGLGAGLRWGLHQGCHAAAQSNV